MSTHTASRKVRASKLTPGMTVVGAGTIAAVTSRDIMPGWPSQPYTMVKVTFTPGDAAVVAAYGSFEWVTVAR
jgi:hypothetical protein